MIYSKSHVVILTQKLMNTGTSFVPSLAIAADAWLAVSKGMCTCGSGTHQFKYLPDMRPYIHI